VWTGTRGSDPLAGDMHGTGTTSIAAGRTVGAAPAALLVVTLGYSDESWSWAAAQPWIDVVSTSVFEAVGSAGTGLCPGAAGAAALARSGRLGFAAAGNGPVDTVALSPGGHPAVLRVGGVTRDGTTALPGAAGETWWSAREYDVAELYRNKIAKTGTDDEYTEAGGTSGSAPRVAGRVAALLGRVRQAVGDRGTGTRSGSVVVAARGRAPRGGPLADGALTGDELRDVVLAVARPATQAGYAVEGYGWFDARAADAAYAVLLGKAPAPARAADDAARTAAVAARTAAYVSRGCPT
jgi:hypothetical protein